MRMLFAWETDGKFFMSFFKQKDKPAKQFRSKDELETEARRRGCNIEWLTKE